MGFIVTVVLGALIFGFSFYVIYNKIKNFGKCNCDGCPNAGCSSYKGLPGLDDIDDIDDIDDYDENNDAKHEK